MKRTYFYNLESCADGSELDMNDVIEELAFDSRGLIPAITQDNTSNEVLMLAWMNETAFKPTLSTGLVTYWSRSRQELWVKGMTSGHTQELISLSIDCDGDTVLCKVNQKGAACHTGRRHCFYLQADDTRQKVRVVDSQPNS